MKSQRPYVKSERKRRGEWYKAVRESAEHTIKQRVNKRPVTNPDGSVYMPKATGAELDRIILAVYFVNVFYKLMLRLPDIRRYRPAYVPKIQQIIDLAETQAKLFAPYLALEPYEAKDWESTV